MRILVLLCSAFLFASGATVKADDYKEERQAMVRTIKAIDRSMRTGSGRFHIDDKVLRGMAEVKRHEFVPWALRLLAYADRPLPIGHGQTISQPFIVALMTDLLDVEEGDKVFEVGTGSGYQAAVLAKLGVRVWTVEIIKALAEDAEARFGKLGYDNVHVRWADGYHGDPENGPYDGIIVTAAASHIPPPLIDQLKPGGRMVIPVGPKFMEQQLLLVEKGADGQVTTRRILPVIFVPVTRKRIP
jgi:protein-L-isoaspartate(D-aspartate) O-methyltransferase